MPIVILKGVEVMMGGILVRGHKAFGSSRQRGLGGIRYRRIAPPACSSFETKIDLAGILRDLRHDLNRSMVG
ncbi:hypothetical protein D3C80_1889880 [compost metagenome]